MCSIILALIEELAMGRCVTALLGATVIMTDMSDRLRLLQKNVDENSYSLSKSHGSACVRGLLWGDQPDQEIVDPLPDFGKMFLIKFAYLPFLKI